MFAQGVPNQTEFAIDLPMERAPGSADIYNQMAFQCMERIWRVATGGRVNDMFTNMMGRRLGFEQEAFFQENSFVLDVPNGDGGLIYGGVNINCRDLGRFGHLWLNQGVWNGDRIVEQSFYDRALERAQAPRAGRRYHWGGPPNVRANGLGDQFVSFNRENGVVITRMGDMTSLGFSAGEFINRVLGSLEREEDIGTWDLAKDAVNDLDESEVKMGQYFAEIMAKQ